MLITVATASPRRTFLAACASFIFLCLLYAQRDAVGTHLAWPNIGPFGLGPEDLWDIPKSWDPLSSIYENFTSIDEKYSPSTKALRGGSARGGAASGPILSNPYERIQPKLVSNDNYRPCVGAHGYRLDISDADNVYKHEGRLPNFAEASMGSSREVGFEQGVCYERDGRFSAYGLNGSDATDWGITDWAELQAQCVEENRERFDLHARPNLMEDDFRPSAQKGLERVARTAIVFRSHQDQVYSQDLLRNMRSVIQELSLRTGGEYQAFLYVEIKDYDLRGIFDDEVLYQELVDTKVPSEFRNMTVLWNEWRWREEYPLLPEDTLLVHKSQWLPMQFFQKQYPEFDYYWNWEMDVRFTGHWFSLIKEVLDWSDAQPRKGLWERNSRFYIPRLHGTYMDYRKWVQDRYRNGSQDTSIWGPFFPGGSPNANQATWLSRLNTTPPVPSPAHDDFEWGVGESADFVTFLPLFDPDTTKYVYQDAYFNYPGSIDSAHMPRRTTIITFSRVSARLLRLMELENVTPPGHHISSESWPQTVALHYGLKAVTVPHGVYMEKRWPAQAIDWIFNNGDKLARLPGFEDLDSRGEGAGGPESTFGLEREHNWWGSTWYYQNRLAERLYKRWLGWEVDGVGGHEWEVTHGHFCLPPMLLHPIKAIDDPGSAAVR